MNDTIKDYFIGSQYTIKTSSIKGEDKKITQFSPMRTEIEFESIKSSINDDGQQKPIYLRNGLLVDGRHRLKACIELGIDINAIDIEPSIDDKTLIRLCNIDTFTSRSPSATQKAFYVMKLQKEYEYNQETAMKIVGTKNTQDVIAAKFIIDNKEYKEKYYEKLNKGDGITIRDANLEIVYRGKSLRKIKSTLATLEQNDNLIGDRVNDSIHIDYNMHLNTEKSKLEFWKRYGKNETMSIDDKMYIIGLLNIVYPM